MANPPRPALYVSRSRSLHLLQPAPTASPFAEAVKAYLGQLGLTVHPHVIDTSEALGSLIGDLASEDNPADAAVFLIESEEAAADASAPSPPPRLSRFAVAAVEIASAQLGPGHTVPVTQIGDPVDTENLSVDVLRLASTADSRSSFKQRLSAAGCTIAGQLLATDQPTNRFDFPSDWWASTGQAHPAPSFTEFLVESAF